MSVSRFRVALLSAEAVPFVKVGGLADVTGALSHAAATLGCSVAVFLPRYGDLELPAGSDLELVARIDVPLSGGDRPGLVYRLRHAGHPAHLHHFFLGNEELFGRPGVYADPSSGEPFPDEAERFAFFSRGCLEAMRAVAYVPDVIHANDHPTALVPAYLKTTLAEDAFFQMTATLLTIHNLGYQGSYPPEAMRIAGFPERFFYPLSPFEFWGTMNCLKAGIQFADRLNTVSERHAEEIQSGDEYGFGLQGVLNARREHLTGILNGIDVKVWNPRTDRALPARFDAETLEGKSICKAALVEELGLSPSPDRPLVGIVSRLVEQKGFELFERAADRLMSLPVRWAVLGRGESRFEDLFRSLRRPPRAPDRGRRGLLPDAVPLRALRSEPDDEHALRHRAGRARDRGARRYRHPVRARRALLPGNRDRVPAVHPRRPRGSGRGGDPPARGCARAHALPQERHGVRFLLGGSRPEVRAALPGSERVPADRYRVRTLAGEHARRGIRSRIVLRRQGVGAPLGRLTLPERAV